VRRSDHREQFRAPASTCALQKTSPIVFEHMDPVALPTLLDVPPQLEDADKV
jgi:hypothetical protein